MIAEARIEITKCRQLCYLAACMMDLKGAKAARKYIAMVKVAAPRMALHIIDEAIQVRVRFTFVCMRCVYTLCTVCAVQCMQCRQCMQMQRVQFVQASRTQYNSVPHMGCSLLLPPHGTPAPSRSSSSSSSASMLGPRGARRVAGFTAGENMDRSPHDASSRRS